GQDEGDIEQLCDGLQPLEPLFAGEVTERIGGGKIEAKLAKAVPQRLGANFPPFLIDDRPARLSVRETRARGALRSRSGAKMNVTIVHGHLTVTRGRGRGLPGTKRAQMVGP